MESFIATNSTYILSIDDLLLCISVLQLSKATVTLAIGAQHTRLPTALSARLSVWFPKGHEAKAKQSITILRLAAQ